RTIVDRHGPAREHGPLDVALAERLFVFGPLFVTVIELAHRSVTPVHDPHVRLRVDVRRPPDQDIPVAAPLLPKPQVPEVRRSRKVPKHGEAGSTGSPTSSARRAAIPCSRSICCTSAGTSSSRLTAI